MLKLSKLSSDLKGNRKLELLILVCELIIVKHIGHKVYNIIETYIFHPSKKVVKLVN